MRLADLSPRWGNGFSEGVFWLAFSCPSCGPPYEVVIYVHSGPQDEALRIWSWNYSSGVPWDGPITILPSILNTNHGRRKACSFHAKITAGEVCLE